MFVQKSTQKTILDLDFNLPEKMLERIKNTWAIVFRNTIMPLLLEAEKEYADLYCRNNGTPNIPVALLLGVLILKEIFDLTDEETLEQLEYNILWQYGLDITFEQAHICRKTLHNFRTKLLESGRHRKLFNKLTKKIIELFGLKIGHQRMDSTHIVGNMKIVGRLGLFIQTIEQFLFKIQKMAKKDEKIASYLEKLPKYFYERYLEREGYFSDSRSSQALRRLATCAHDLWELVELFKNDPVINILKQFKTLKRLFKEQCKVVKTQNDKVEIEVSEEPDEDGKISSTNGEEKEPEIAQKQVESQNPIQATTTTKENAESLPVSGEEKEPEIAQKQVESQNPIQATMTATKIKIELKKTKDISSDSLQSPTDNDATYGHKGKGYEFQIAETCDSQNPFQVITENHLNGANISDQTETIKMIEKLQQAQLQPQVLKVDAGYVSGENIIAAEDKGTELVGPLPGSKPNNLERLSLNSFSFTKDGNCIEHCLNGKTPVEQGELKNGTSHYADFSLQDCSCCPFYDHCPAKGTSKRRIEWDRKKLTIAQRQKEVNTKEFKEGYKIRSGIESTNCELKHKHGAAKLRVRGYSKIDFSMVFKSLAINIKRMIHYVLDQQGKTDPGAPDLSSSLIFLFISLLQAVIILFISKIKQFWATDLSHREICNFV